MVIYINTSISKPKVYMNHFRAWAAPLHYMELHFQHFVKIKYQYHSSIVNDTDINRDINIHKPEKYLWRLCLHSSEKSAWKGKN